MRRLALATPCLFATIALLVACGQSRRGTPYTQPVALESPQIATGQIAFMQHCNQCHPGGAAGLGPAINDKPLPAFLIKTQIRRGLGAMPAFDEKHISDNEMNAVVAYLQNLRKAQPRYASR